MERRLSLALSIPDSQSGGTFPMQSLEDEVVGVLGLLKPTECCSSPEAHILFITRDEMYQRGCRSGIHSPWLYSKICIYGLCC